MCAAAVAVLLANLPQLSYELLTGFPAYLAVASVCVWVTEIIVGSAANKLSRLIGGRANPFLPQDSIHWRGAVRALVLSFALPVLVIVGAL